VVARVLGIELGIDEDPLPGDADQQGGVADERQVHAICTVSPQDPPLVLTWR
jgi:hypothetical protein